MADRHKCIINAMHQNELYQSSLHFPRKIEGSSLKATNLQYRADEVTFANVSTLLEG